MNKRLTVLSIAAGVPKLEGFPKPPNLLIYMWDCQQHGCPSDHSARVPLPVRW